MSNNNFSIDVETCLNKPLLEALDEIANCNICKNIVCNPMECNKCEHCFCKTCIDNWLSQSHSCPFKCNGMSFKESRMARSMLGSLIFKCVRCGEVIKYENCESHFSSCPFQSNRTLQKKKKSKFEKYDEVETKEHEHVLSIIKSNQMRESLEDNNKSAQKYFWTCNICKKNYALDIMSAYCEECGFEECEECILRQDNQWFVHIVI